jgi:hypothetical protein
LKSKRFVLSRRKNKKDRKTDDEAKLILEVLLKLDPLLKTAWELKEEGLAIFDKPATPQHAKEKFQVWVEKVRVSDAEMFYKPVIETIEKWNDALFVIPGSKYDNARTEAKVGFMKLRRALGRGISFKAIRALMIWGDAHRRTAVWPEEFKTDKQRTLDRLLRWIDEDQNRLEFVYPKRESM